MLLHDHMSRTGAQLFRWRSYLLLAFVPFLLIAMAQGSRIEAAFGSWAALAYDLLCIALVLALVLVLVPYYERIIAAEESFLVQSFGQPYRDWAATTPAFIPSLRAWVPPALRFSLKTVIRREQASVFGAVLALYLVKLGLHLLGGAALPGGWHWALAVAAAVEALAWFAKTRTTGLQVAGR